MKNKEIADDLENVLFDLTHGEIYPAMKYLEDIITNLKKEEKNCCDICYEPINEMKRVCGMCADNRVADGIWTEEEKNEKMYKEEE
jgi:hypothetical protein